MFEHNQTAYDDTENIIGPAEETLQGLQGGAWHLPQTRQLPQPPRVQIPKQARLSRYALLGEAEGVVVPGTKPSVYRD